MRPGHTMPRPNLWFQTSAVFAVACALALTGCSKQDVGTNSFAAGHDYGKALKSNFSSKASKAQLSQACAKAIVDHHLVDNDTGKPGKKVGYVVGQFVQGCEAALKGQ